jgi:hypothetical protein
MWILVITLFGVSPGVPASKGSLQAAVGNYDDCIRTKEQIIKTFRVDNYRINVSCLLLP